MKTLLIDENGVMYWAGTKDFYDLMFSRRRKASILPTLEQTDEANVSREAWRNREYVDFFCNVEANSRKFNKVKMMKGGRTVNAYGYLQELRKNQWNVAALIEGHKYIIPMEDAVEYTLGFINRVGLINRMEAREPDRRDFDHLGITRYLIVV